MRMEKITLQEAKNWLASQEFVRCKEIATDLLFDATKYGEDAVLVRQSSPTPMNFYVLSLDLFAEKFDEVCIPVE
jgi:hypothetical protein